MDPEEYETVLMKQHKDNCTLLACQHTNDGGAEVH